MVDFDKLNRQTREYNNRNCDRFNPSTRSNYRTSINECNNRTYYSNNGIYANHYKNK